MNQTMVKQSSFDVNQIRQQFPILSTKMMGKQLVYLDNGATTQKPKSVIQALERYYSTKNSNIHRGIYAISEESTIAYERVRARTAKFVGCDPSEIVFTSGTTASINLVASGIAHTLKDGDEILVTLLEHHSNLVPWQQIAKKTGARIRYVNLTVDGELDMLDLASKINDKTKIVAVTHISNVLGTIVDVKKICGLAHEHRALVVVDGAQAIAHQKVEVLSIDCDFYVFSAHKMYGPTGVGVLYGKKELLKTLEPQMTGGGMINTVDMTRSTWAEIPWRFEAGTPNIAGVIGFGEAINFINDIDLENISYHEKRLTEHALNRLCGIKGLKVDGPKTRGPVVSFVIEDMHPHDVAELLNRQGIAVRAGHHCAMPLMTHLRYSSTTRVSFSIYNTIEEIDHLVESIKKAIEVFS